MVWCAQQRDASAAAAMAHHKQQPIKHKQPSPPPQGPSSPDLDVVELQTSPQTDPQPPPGPLSGIITQRRTRSIIVPLMLFAASMIMALAWLGHLRFQEYPFLTAMLACWLLVLPEYVLNISAIRLGYGIYTGAQMASLRLSSGVICVALVSRFFLGEEISLRQGLGFALMVVAILLITLTRSGSEDAPKEEG